MNPFLHKHRNIFAAVAGCLLIGGLTMSFQNTPFGPIDKLDTLTDLQDTVPAKPRTGDAPMNINDFDLLMKNLDKEILKLQKEVTTADLDKMHEQINASLDKVDFDKIKKGIDKAM